MGLKDILGPTESPIPECLLLTLRPKASACLLPQGARKGAKEGHLRNLPLLQGKNSLAVAPNSCLPQQAYNPCGCEANSPSTELGRQ